MSKFEDGTNSILHISSKNIKDDCSDVINALNRNHILFHYNVTPNKTIRYKDNKRIYENGCRINIMGIKKKWIKPIVWVPLKYELMLNCGHLKINTYLSNNTWFGGYDGCINKFNY